MEITGPNLIMKKEKKKMYVINVNINFQIGLLKDLMLYTEYPAVFTHKPLFDLISRSASTVTSCHSNSIPFVLYAKAKQNNNYFSTKPSN